MNDVRRLRLEELITQNAKQFQLDALISALAGLGYSPQDIRFESHPELGPARSLIESVRFETWGVLVAMNLGLTGGLGLLPSYFDEMAEKLPDASVLYRFLQFFDDGLLRKFSEAITPEYHARWPLIQKTHFSMLGHGSVSTLTWLFGLYYPELEVQVKRAELATLTDAYAIRMGKSNLDGSGVLGPTYDVSKSGFEIRLYVAEHHPSHNHDWWNIATQRLHEYILPLLSGQAIRLRVILVFRNPEETAELSELSRLGAQSIGGQPAEHHIIIYSEQSFTCNKSTDSFPHKSPKSKHIANGR